MKTRNWVLLLGVSATFACGDDKTTDGQTATTTTPMATTMAPAMTTMAPAMTSAVPATTGTMKPAGGSCSRETLTVGTKALAEALKAGDFTKLPTTSVAPYLQNLMGNSAKDGIFKAPLVIANQRDVLDVMQCESFSEIVVTEGTAYVLGIRLKQTADSKISDVTALVADMDDWHFDAANFLTTAKKEDWSTVPEGKRPTRAAAVAAGNAYFDSFNDASVKPPYGTGCIRLEGLAEENVGCSEKLPPPCRVRVSDRTSLFDDTLGTAVFFDKFRGLPDSHQFRVVDGKITNIHAIIICDPDCMPPTVADPGLASCVPPPAPPPSTTSSATTSGSATGSAAPSTSASGSGSTSASGSASGTGPKPTASTSSTGAPSTSTSASATGSAAPTTSATN